MDDTVFLFQGKFIGVPSIAEGLMSQSFKGTAQPPVMEGIDGVAELRFDGVIETAQNDGQGPQFILAEYVMMAFDNTGKMVNVDEGTFQAVKVPIEFGFDITGHYLVDISNVLAKGERETWVMDVEEVAAVALRTGDIENEEGTHDMMVAVFDTSFFGVFANVLGTHGVLGGTITETEGVVELQGALYARVAKGIVMPVTLASFHALRSD